VFKKALITFLATLAIASNVWAQSLTLLGAGSGDSLLPNQIIFQTSQICNPSSGACTISNAALGVAQSNRYIVVLMHNNAGCASPTLTVNGVSATLSKQFSTSNIFIAAVPNGATGNISYSNCTASNAYLGWYTIYGLNSITPDSTCQAASAACSLGTTVSGGYALSVLGNTTSNSFSCTLSGGTSPVTDYGINYATNIATGGGHSSVTTSSVTLTWAGTNCAVIAGAAYH